MLRTRLDRWTNGELPPYRAGRTGRAFGNDRGTATVKRDAAEPRVVFGTAGPADRSTVVREGTTLAVGREVAAAPEPTAKTLRDSRRWPEWSPSVDAVESADRFVETGTTGRVRVAGVWTPFRVTAATRLRWDWRVAGVPATGHRVDRYPGRSDRCRVVVAVPLVAAAYVPVCRRALDRFAALVGADG